MRFRRLSPYRIAIGAIAALQAVVIGALGAAGYFYLDDIDMTAEAAKHPFSWAYVSMGLNDHFTPGLRSVFWAIAHFAPYDNGVTVLGRVLAQVVATLLFGYLLRLLVGPSRLAVFGVALYAFSPLLVPSLLSLSSAVNLLPTHISVVLLTVMHIRFHVTRRYRYAIVGAIGLLLGLLFWEKAVLGLSLPVLLTFLYLAAGPLTSRLQVVLRDSAAWLTYLLPVAGFYWYYLSGGYPRFGLHFDAANVWTVFWESWLHATGPTVVGGPWNWIAIDSVYCSAAAPGLLVTLLGQAALLTTAFLGVRRHGRAALRSWVIVAVYLVGVAIVLAAARFGFFGVLITRNFHYYSELAIPLVLAIVLCLGAPTADAIRTRVIGEPTADTSLQLAVTRPVGIGLVFAVLAYALSYGVTAGGFERRWVQNPIREYMSTAIRDMNAHTTDREISVYDTFAPGWVAPPMEANRRMSDIVRPVVGDLEHPVSWDDASTPMYMFDTQGHLIKAKLVPEAGSPTVPGASCSYLLRGAMSMTVPLSNRITRPDGFLWLSYVSTSATRISIELGDGTTSFAPRRNGAAELVVGGGHAVVVPTPDMAFDRAVVSSTDPGAVICLNARAGYAAADLR